MRNRSAWDDYSELMTLLPEGNRQLAAAITGKLRELLRFVGRGLRRLTA
jgi:hypothetical protein